MEFNLQRTVLEGYRPILDTVLTQEETMESIVPDAFPDVSRIISTDGNAFIAAKHVGEGSTKIMGTLCLNVLYVPEGETLPRSLTMNLPFQCTGDCPKINENAQIHVSVLSVIADARMVNPRKLFVKAEVKLRAKVYMRDSKEAACGMADDDNGVLQKQMREYKNFVIAAVLEKPFLFSDTLRQSASKPMMEELLCCSAEPGTIEAKYIGKKLVCKGEMILSVLYRSGQELFPGRFELPFSQILEMESSFNEGEPDVSVVLKNADCSLRDGELDISVEALIQSTLWSYHSVMLLSDLYSTAEPLDVTRGTCEICTASESGSKRENARKFCESGIPAKQVLRCTVCMNPLVSARQGNSMRYETTANVDVLYLSEDDALCGGAYSIPVSCELDVPVDHCCTCHCQPVGEATAVPVTGGFEVRLEAEFSWYLTKIEATPCVASVRPGNTVVGNEPKPSVIIRMVSAGESLWDVAKTCCSTIQDICAANNLTGEIVEAGSVLLIPTKR